MVALTVSIPESNVLLINMVCILSYLKPLQNNFAGFILTELIFEIGSKHCRPAIRRSIYTSDTVVCVFTQTVLKVTSTSKLLY